jgi:NADH-quinone oxidoreductase subunit F
MTKAYNALFESALEHHEVLDSKLKINVGMAICGEAAGSFEVMEAIRHEVIAQGLDAVVSEVGCLGLCYAEPLVDIQFPGKPRLFYGNVKPENLPSLKQIRVKGKNIPLATLGTPGLPGIPDLYDLPMMIRQVRIALRNVGHIDPTDLHQYIARGGYKALDTALTEMTPDEVIEQVKLSGLRGRGGAAFSTGTKWSFLKSSKASEKYILCNAEEGDPGAFNDKGILESDPHTLIEGMLLAGYATGANYGYVFIRHGHDGPIRRTQIAIEQAYKSGLLGKNILGTGFNFDAEMSLVGESYVSGEETALMEAIEGKRAMPRYRPPFPAAFGVWGKPSNINNIKTLAYIPEIISKGGNWFSEIGVGGSSGTAILCLSGNIKRPGMVEVPMGLTMRAVVEELGGGVPTGKVKFLQTGGPLGGVLGANKLGVKLDFKAMSDAGAILGSGGIIVANESVCAVDMTRLLVAFCQYESCGKCFPCRLGTTHLLEILERMCRFESIPSDMDLMQVVGKEMASASLCGHGQLGFNPVQSALDYFGQEFKIHIEEGRCQTGSCDINFITPTRTRR